MPRPGPVHAFILTAVLVSPILRAQTPVPCSTGSFGGEIGPINISGHFVLPDDCTLDYKGREIVIRGTLEAKNFTLTAAKLTIADTGSLVGNGGVIAIDILESVTLDGSMTVDGLLESNGTHGGVIAVGTAGPFSVGATGRMETSALGMDGSGGFVAVESAGPLSLAPGSLVGAAAGIEGSIGGLVSFVSKDSALLMGQIEVKGGLDAGGNVIARAALDLESGPVLAGARCEAGNCQRASSVDLAAGGALTLRGTVKAPGSAGGTVAGDGNAGSLKLDAGGDLSVLADVDLGGAELGRGGSFKARADGDYAGSKVLSVQGTGPGSAGGVISIDAGLEARISGAIHAGADEDGDGGTVQIAAEGDVLLRASLQASANFPAAGIEIVSRSAGIELASKVEARGLGDFGTGGTIALYSVKAANVDRSLLDVSGEGPDGLGGTIVIDAFEDAALGTAMLLAGGDAADPALGEGGTVEVNGCAVTVEGGSIKAEGKQGGSIFISGSDAVLLEGTFSAEEGGLFSVKHAPGSPPSITGTLATRPDLDPSIVLEPCLGAVPCDPVASLACTPGGGTAHLAWTAVPGQTLVDIFRDDELIDTVEAASGEYDDFDAPAGLHEYTVVGACLSGPASPALCSVEVLPGEGQFDRGDCNPSGVLDISDAVFLLGYLFQGNPSSIPCEKTCDATDDGELDISDSIRILTILFLVQDGELPDPFGTCGTDPTEDSLTCERFTCN